MLKFTTVISYRDDKTGLYKMGEIFVYESSKEERKLFSLTSEGFKSPLEYEDTKTEGFYKYLTDMFGEPAYYLMFIYSGDIYIDDVIGGDKIPATYYIASGKEKDLSIQDFLNRNGDYFI